MRDYINNQQNFGGQAVQVGTDEDENQVVLYGLRQLKFGDTHRNILHQCKVPPSEICDFEGGNRQYTLEWCTFNEALLWCFMIGLYVGKTHSALLFF